MDGEYGVAAARCLVRMVIGGGSVLFTFKEAVEGFFFITALSCSQSFNVDFTLLVILNGDVCASLLVSGYGREHIEHKLVVDFNE